MSLLLGNTGLSFSVCDVLAWLWAQGSSGLVACVRRRPSSSLSWTSLRIVSIESLNV